MFNELIKHIGNRQIVLLGESAHGIMEQNQLRIDLIKLLNKELGFKHLLIESVKSPISHKEFLKIHSIDYLKNFLHNVYHTEEMIPLVELAKESKLQIDGFEIEGADLEKYFEMKKVNDRDSRTFRDKTMFDNFKKLMDDKIKSDKVIIWGHNAHMMKKVSKGAYRDKVFGEYVKETYGDRSIVVGQYTGSGEIEHMPHQKRKLLQEKHSIEEYIIKTIEGIKVFPTLDEDIFMKPIKNMFCGGEIEELILADHFDSLILHEKGSAPSRL